MKAGWWDTPCAPGFSRSNTHSQFWPRTIFRHPLHIFLFLFGLLLILLIFRLSVGHPPLLSPIIWNWRVFENCQNSFHGVSPLVHSDLQNTWILEDEAVRPKFCPIQFRNHTPEESKNPGFTFSIELRINSELFKVISWSIWAPTPTTLKDQTIIWSCEVTWQNKYVTYPLLLPTATKHDKVMTRYENLPLTWPDKFTK